MTRLSVNINKIALLRNSRNIGVPDVVRFAQDCEAFGAQGITVHPRPDQRHIRFDDIPTLKKVVTTELNIEGNPTPAFIDLVLAHRPHQVTLVPDDPNQLTSDHGWNTLEHQAFLKKTVSTFQEAGIRVSLFVDPVIEMVEGAQQTGTDCIELYTEPYASHFSQDQHAAVTPYVEATHRAVELGLIINAGHDLNLENLQFFKDSLPKLDEVSIGHALVADALYYGIENTIGMYRQRLR